MTNDHSLFKEGFKIKIIKKFFLLTNMFNNTSLITNKLLQISLKSWKNLQWCDKGKCIQSSVGKRARVLNFLLTYLTQGSWYFFCLKVSLHVGLSVDQKPD